MTLAGQTIAVTGATGFLGSHIALALVEAGAEVVGVVRTPEKGAWMKGVSFRRADLADEDALTAAFTGCDAVVANAALAVKGGASLEAFRAANIGGVERTMGAVHRAGVGRVLHISSVGVYQVRWRGAMDESTPVRTRFRLDPSLFTTNWRYTLTKAQGEGRARVLAEELGLKLTIFRPGPVYGARDPKFTAKLAQRVQGSWTFAPNVRLPMVHAGDIATGVVAALGTEVSVGKVYNFGGVSHPLPEVLRQVAGILERPCRVLSVPTGLGVQFDDGAARRDLGLIHRPLVDGLREALYSPDTE